jgi:hypothetical protein
VALVDNRNIRDGLVPDRSRQTNESEWTRLLIAKGYAVLAESERRPDAPPLVNAAATAAQEPAQPQPATSRPASTPERRRNLQATAERFRRRYRRRDHGQK